MICKLSTPGSFRNSQVLGRELAKDGLAKMAASLQSILTEASSEALSSMATLPVHGDAKLSDFKNLRLPLIAHARQWKCQPGFPIGVAEESGIQAASAHDEACEIAAKAGYGENVIFELLPAFRVTQAFCSLAGVTLKCPGNSVARVAFGDNETVRSLLSKVLLLRSEIEGPSLPAAKYLAG